MTASALSSWLLTSGPSPFCLWKLFSCRACPGICDLRGRRAKELPSSTFERRPRRIGRRPDGINEERGGTSISLKRINLLCPAFLAAEQRNSSLFNLLGRKNRRRTSLLFLLSLCPRGHQLLLSSGSSEHSFYVKIGPNIVIGLYSSNRLHSGHGKTMLLPDVLSMKF